MHRLTPDELRELEEKLKSARPRLIGHCDLDVEYERQAKLTFYIREGEPSGDQILDEGFDPEYSSLGVPVYWRVVVRGDERLYCSTFQATRERIIKGWGQIGLEHADPGTGTAVVCLETVIDPATPVRCTSTPAVDEDLRYRARMRRASSSSGTQDHDPPDASYRLSHPNIAAFIAELVRELDGVVWQAAEAQSAVPYTFLLDAIVELLIIWCRRFEEAQGAARGEPETVGWPADLRNLAITWIDANLKYITEPKDKLP